MVLRFREVITGSWHERCEEKLAKAAEAQKLAQQALQEQIAVVSVRTDDHSPGEAMCPSLARRVRFDLDANSMHEYALEDAHSESTEVLENMQFSEDDLEEDPDYLEYLRSGDSREQTAEAIDEDEYV